MPTHEQYKGTTSDTRDAKVDGLPGLMPKPVKVVVLGAGSNFTPRLITDILAIPNNRGGTISLIDIDEGRLSQMQQLIGQVVQNSPNTSWAVEASTDRKILLKAADYVVICIEVNGLHCVPFENDIPLKYGIRQCIGDTVGPGGVFKGLRTIPVFLDILRDVELLAPNAIVLNYTNPMAMMVLAAGRSTRANVVGLCHSVQGTSQLLADRAQVPIEEMDWECAGINHLAWFTKLKHQGVDLYPRLMEMARSDLAGRPIKDDDRFDLVRKDMMLHFGAFITESSPHLSEYLPYYRRRDDTLERYCHEKFPGDGSRTGTRYYADMWPDSRKDADRERAAMIDGTKPIDWKRSWEYASWIIEAREKDHPFQIHGNVMNGLGAESPAWIENFPKDSCVEVPCRIDGKGIHPLSIGKLPPQMAAVCNWNLGVIDLGAQAAIERSRELATQAVMIDPLTAATCTPEEIQRMVDEMFEAGKPWLPGFD